MRARELYGRAGHLLRDLGGAVLAAWTSLASARVELLAGDPARAERELARDYEALAALGERYFLPLIAAHLAQAVQAQGRDEEATTLAAKARELADEDDVEAQALWRRVLAKALAREGLLDEAEELAREGLGALEPTDAPVMQADALVDLAEVLLSDGRPGPRQRSKRRSTSTRRRATSCQPPACGPSSAHWCRKEPDSARVAGILARAEHLQHDPDPLLAVLRDLDDAAVLAGRQRAFLHAPDRLCRVLVGRLPEDEVLRLRAGRENLLLEGGEWPRS